jgi:YD repeat-containing protein
MTGQRHRSIAVAACLFFASTLYAGNAAEERGFKAEGAYQFNGFDSVNLSNGNLILTVPLSSTYTVDSLISYSFVLRYSGKVWQDITYEKPRGQQEWIHTNLVPRGENVALGWSLSFGSLRKGSGTGGTITFTYGTADGSEHTFYQTLHEPRCPSSRDCDTVVVGYGYTRDGTYLRLRYTDTSAVIEFPNGERHRYEPGAGNSGNWRPTHIYSVFSAMSGDLPTTNYVLFDYSTADVWLIKAYGDALLRTHKVIFSPPEPLNPTKITSVQLDAASPSSMTVTFNQRRPTVVKPCRDDETVAVTLLDKITLPNNEAYSFTYYEQATRDCQTNALLADSSGLVKTATLPTLGQLEWAYQHYDFSDADMDSMGVKQRLVKGAGTSGAILQRQDYETVNGVTTVLACTELTAEGTCKPESKTVNYSINDLHSPYFGLPFTLGTPASGSPNPDSQQRYLSNETFDCPAAGGCALQTRTYVKYELDEIGDDCLPLSGEACVRDRNRRTVSQSTEHVTDLDDNEQPRFSDVTYSQFDGLGHYRKTVLGGSFKGTNGRETFVNFNAGAGTYNLLNGTRQSGFQMIAHTAAWLLETHTDGYEKENGLIAHLQACFDAATGFLLRARNLRGTVPDAKDVLAVFTAASGGFRSSERWFGGDPGGLPAGALCTLTPPSSHTVKLDYTYENGALKTSQYVPNGGTLSFFSVNQVVNPVKSLVTKTIDTAGIETNYSYDNVGRITALTPTGAAATTYTYVNANAATNAPAKVTVSTGSAQFPSVPMMHEYEYDALGRVSRERRLMPGSSWSVRKTTYDSLGRKHSVSEWEAETGATYAHKTTFSGYDVFGRPGKITAPDGSETDFEYVGSSLVRRKTSGGGNVLISDITVVEEYDRDGRLIRITEPSGAPGPNVNVSTEYTYGLGNRLSTVKTTGSNTVQNRIFSYDARGFLLWESHPESGVRAYTYDARGHVLSMNVGAAKTLFDVRYTYDGAERLTQVEGRSATNSDTFRPVKTFTYGTENGQNPADHRNGKLWVASRFNYGPNDPYMPPDSEWNRTIKVSETHTYGDAAGRLTKRETKIEKKSYYSDDWTTLRTISQGVAYNELSRPETISYPMCINCGTPPEEPQRNVTSVYQAGRITQLTDSSTAFLSSISYWPNGLRNTIQRDNGMTDTQTYDTANGVARPLRMKSYTAAPCIAPSVISKTEAATVSAAQPSVTLSVTASGTSLSYQWYTYNGGNQQIINGATGSSVTVSPTVDTTYLVDIWNSCGPVSAGALITVKVGSCVPPWIVKSGYVRSATGVVTLTASAGGTGTLQFEFGRVSDNALVGSVSGTQASPASVSVGAITTDTAFTVAVTNACGGPAATATINTAVPTTLQSISVNAEHIGGNQIRISWDPVPTAATYSITRSDAPGAVIATVTGSPFTHMNVAANQVYIYYVTAHDDESSEIARSGDLTSTLAFSVIEPRKTGVANAHAEQLLTALNAVRALAGWAPVTWENIVPPSTPTPFVGATVSARHITAIRARLNEAVQSMRLPFSGYTDPDLNGVPIKALHVTELQGRFK